LLKIEVITTANQRKKTFHFISEQEKELLLSRIALLNPVHEVSRLLFDFAAQAEQQDRDELLREQARCINLPYQFNHIVAGSNLGETEAPVELQAA